jgi:putative transposase
MKPRFADLAPAHIVPIPADEGEYIAIESTFSRVLQLMVNLVTVGE